MLRVVGTMPTTKKGQHFGQKFKFKRIFNIYVLFLALPLLAAMYYNVQLYKYMWQPQELSVAVYDETFTRTCPRTSPY